MLIHDARELGLRMRDQRLALGLTQTALAARVGVGRLWVSKMERGNAGAEVGLVFKALGALGLLVDVRAEASPRPPSPAGESWVPDLAAILDRARRARP